MRDVNYDATRQSYGVLIHDVFDGFEYVISDGASYPCAYVRIPDNHPFFKKKRKDIEDKFQCHCGCSYSSYRCPALKEKSGQWWIGWDYGHACDYQEYMSEPYSGKKWTTTEIIDECKEVITQLRKVFT